MTRKRRAKGKRGGRPAGVTHRSGFEAAIRKDLDARGVEYQYEAKRYALDLSILRHYCQKCGSTFILKTVKYTPDFTFPNGLVVEAKGKFTTRDRKIALAFVSQTNVPYAMIFQRDNKLSPKSSTRYTQWCAENKIRCAVGTEIPKEWLR